MSRKLLIICIVALIAVPSVLVAQDDMERSDARHLVSFNPFAPLFGLITGSYESKIGENLSFTIAPFYQNIGLTFLGSAITDGEFSQWSTGAVVGGNYYPNGALEELFVGAALRSTYFYLGDGTNEFTTFSMGAQATVGYRWIFDWFSIGPSIGLGYNVLFASTSEFENEAQRLSGFRVPWGLGMAIAF